MVARDWLWRLAGAAGVALASGGATHAEPIPSLFHGEWIVAVAENSACKAGDWQKRENDGLLKIDKNDAMFYESSCKVKRIRPSPWDGAPSVDMTMTCGGEGEMSSTREIWSVVQVGSRKALVMTQLEASDGVPVESKKMPPLRRSIGAKIYLACE